MDTEVAVQVCAAFLGGGIVAYFALARPAQGRVARLECRLSKREEQVLGKQEELSSTKQEKAQVEATLKAERDNFAHREEEIEKRFSTTASNALNQNSRMLLQLVSERFDQHKVDADRDLERRQTAIRNLVTPIGKELGKFERTVGQIEAKREGAYRALAEQVKSLKESQRGLHAETGRLVQALRQPKTRGRWGEIQLQRVLEMAGMSEYVDFLTEQSIAGDEATLRPDVIVRLPGGKRAVIDAKTPLDGYLRSVEAEGEEGRDQALRDHARQLRNHVSHLASKQYSGQLPDSPEFVVMFVPGEALYDAAARTDPDIFESAVEKRVLIATPTTLIALLKAVAFGWQQERLAENAQVVADQARKLYKRIRVFGDHMDKLGKSLRQAVDRYNKSVGSLEARLLPAARRFEVLGVTPDHATLPVLQPVDLDPRTPRAREIDTDKGLPPEDR